MELAFPIKVTVYFATSCRNSCTYDVLPSSFDENFQYIKKNQKESKKKN